MANVQDRAMGETLAFSVPTAIPLEENLADLGKKVDHVWMNIYTLFRNYHGSFEDPLLVDRGEFIQGFADELATLHGFVNAEVPTHYYITAVDALKHRLPLAKVKTPHTQRQLVYKNLERLAIDNLKRQQGIPVLQLQHTLPEMRGRGWVLTHHAIDLLSRYQFSDMQLLESHTGHIRPPVEWIRKLTTNESYYHLPFNLLTMQVLGDRGTLLYAGSHAHKKALVACAADGKWKPTTTREKVRSDVRTITDSDIQEQFTKMLAVRLP